MSQKTDSIFGIIRITQMSDRAVGLQQNRRTHRMYTQMEYQASAVFSGITILCIIKWMSVMLRTEIGDGIGPAEVVPLLTAMVSFAAAAICRIWMKEG